MCQITFLVVREALGKHKFHILYELLQRLIAIILKVTLDGAKFHIMLGYAKTIRDLISIDRLKKYFCIIVGHHLFENFLGSA